MSSNSFIRCPNCGVEFRSFAAEAAIAIGCSEQCPSCRTIVATPFFSGGRNMDRLQEQFQLPMIKQYGEDGYIFLGRGYLASSIQSTSILPVYTAYDRNLQRALDLLDLFDVVGLERAQLILSTVINATMTAYECLTDDTHKVLVRIHPRTKSAPRMGLREKREAVLSALELPIIDGGAISLRYAYEIRNCLTHSAGVIDDQFIKNVRKIGDIPELTAPGVGAPLVLHRSMTTSFLDTLQHFASRILTKTEELAKKREKRGGSNA